MLTVTDLFAGFGGASTGAISVPGVELTIAANHWDLAVEVHNMNHPEADHACVDLHLEDPRYFPKTDILWASPECTTWSSAAGAAHAEARVPGDWNLFEEIGEDLIDDDAAVRSRLLMFDVLRFIEHHRYAGVIIENVVDIATKQKYAPAWRLWQDQLRGLGYDFRVVSLNSMHAQAMGMPAPQSRDRLYVVAWPKGNRAPDIEKFMRPKAWCPSCEKFVESIQTWKNGRTVGKYRQQYFYRCSTPGCSTAVEPGWLPAASAIDWTMPGTRIGDRKRPLADKTRARIAAGIARYWRPMMVEAAGNTWDASDPNHPGHGNPNSYYRAFPIEEWLRTLDVTSGKALCVPVEGRDGKKAKDVAEAMRTLTTRSETALALMPFIAELKGGSSDARSVAEALCTIHANGNHHGLVSPYYSATKSAKSTDDPVDTLTTVDRFGLIQNPAFLTQFRERTRDLDPQAKPLPTVVADGANHALVQRHNSSNGDGSEMLTPAHEVMRTLTSKGHQSLVTPGDVKAAEAMVDDCLFRMLEPHEIGAGMAFAPDYKVKGTRRNQVKGYGNAVTPPAARDLVAALVESLGHEVAA